MANAPIAFPRLYQTRLPWVQQREQQPNYTTDNTTYPFVAGQFVKLVSGTLRPYVADDIILYGLSLDASTLATTAEAYATPFGQNHNPVSLNGGRFIMNITDASGTVGSGTTTQAAVAIGTLYSGTYLASPYGNVLGVDASDSGTATKNIFKVVGLYTVAAGFSDGDATADFNGRVIVEILGSAIQ